MSPAGATQLNPATAATLTPKWVFRSKGPIAATPTVEQGGIYVTDQTGWLYKIDPTAGTAIWSNPITSYTGATFGGVGSRNSPAIGALGEIVVGDRSTPTVFAVNRTTGQLMWETKVDNQSYAFITASAVIYQGVVYIGVASGEESVTEHTPTYVPAFRGSVVALQESTGKLLWKFYTTPAGYTGSGVWSSQPVVYPAANALIFATGNNYTVPASVQTCVLNSGTTHAQRANQGLKCLDPTDQVDAIVSVDLTTGLFNWSRRLQGPDTINGTCGDHLPACPNPEGVDADFASAPNLINVPNFVGVADDRGGVSNNYLIGAGEKSGVYWGINPANGGVFWSAFAGNGQILWGTAINTSTDAAALVAIDNGGQNYLNLLAGVNGHPQYWNAGSWGAVNLLTGKFIWQLPAYGQDLANPALGSAAPGAISFSNGVAFASSSSGYMVGFDAATGQVLWKYDTGGSISSGPAIFNDTLYWGAGQGSTGGGTLYAFSITESGNRDTSH